MELSVIVPVYNTRPYLRDCIDSVIASEGSARWELLLVNDGSTDGSEALLREYAEKYPNIRYLDYGGPPRNRGQNAARNLGIANARGEYLLFLDSDDALRQGYLEALYRAAREGKCEIVYGGFSRWDEDVIPVKRSVLESAPVMTGREFVNRRMDGNDPHNYAWCALYHRSLFREKGLRFEESISLYEDILFFWQAAAMAERVTALPEYGYLYRVRGGSLTRNSLHRRDVDELWAVLARLSAQPEEKALSRLCFMAVSMYLYYLGALTETKQLSPQERADYYRRLSELSLLPRLRRAAATRNEKLKWLLWSVNWKLFYPLVRK